MTKHKTSSTNYVILLSILFLSCLIASNLAAEKPLLITPYCYVPGGALIFPFSFLLDNVITEVYGYKYSRYIINASVLGILVLVGYLTMTIHWPSPAFWENQKSYESIYSTKGFVFIISIFSMWISTQINSIILSKLKVQGKVSLFWRCVRSTTVAVTVDSLIFVPLIFMNTTNLSEKLVMALSLYALKVGIEILLFPLTKFVIRNVKRLENIDTYDYNTKYTPFSLNIDYDDYQKLGSLG